jgi:AcrR family transcriptional regulator
MTPQRTLKTRRGGPLNAGSILHAAISILDQEGLEALSMRHLAGKLGVTPMAVYNHFQNKEELTARVAEAILGELTGPPQEGDWPQRLQAYFQALRNVCLSHPNAMPLVEKMQNSSVAFWRPMEVSLTILSEAGFSPFKAMNAYCTLIAFTIGHVSYQLGGSSRTDATVDTDVISNAGLPHVAQIIGSTPNWDFDNAFEFGIEVIIDGLRRRAPS